MPKARPLELVWVDPRDLEKNPLNWRLHPAPQREAVDALLDDVGWAGALLFNRRTGRLIDGHLRRDLAIERGEEAVPVLIGEWTEEQERRLLALYDHTTAMAETDGAALDALLQRISAETEDAAILQAISSVSEGGDSPWSEPDVGEFSDDADPTPSGPRLVFSFVGEDERDRFFSFFGVPPAGALVVTASELLAARERADGADGPGADGG